jgi:uncharacterized membrane protein SpoIIM required for sporulation
MIAWQAIFVFGFFVGWFLRAIIECYYLSKNNKEKKQDDN